MDSRMIETPASALIPVQGRVFDDVVSNDLLVGTLHNLAQEFGVDSDHFLACLDGLAQAGWVTVATDPEGLFSVCLKP